MVMYPGRKIGLIQPIGIGWIEDTINRDGGMKSNLIPQESWTWDRCVLLQARRVGKPALRSTNPTGCVAPRVGQVSLPADPTTT